VFALGTFCLNGGDRYPGLVVGDHVSDLRPAFGEHTTTMDLLCDWESALERLRALAVADLSNPRRLADVRALPPIEPLGQIMCAGANYRSHTVEMLMLAARNKPGEARSEEMLRSEAEAEADRRLKTRTPFMFVAQASAVSGADDDIVLWDPGVEHDWELELAVVIGRGGADISVAEAMSHVAGYTISNDISTRDMLFRPGFTLSDFMRSKLRPTFFPTGPFMVPREFIDDYRDLRLTLRVNGELMQDELVAGISYGVEELIAYASGLVELRPGDLLLTGSPAGNAGIHGNRWLRPGDVIDSTITGLGSQRNRCVSDPHRALSAVVAAGGFGR
jgi:2,4-didehydro-3-deoxy-L-rhamnonate hydrolase